MLSVLVRSIGRSSLVRALDSIEIQGKEDLVVVLVDARGDLFESIPAQTTLLDGSLLARVLATSREKHPTLRLGFTKPSENRSNGRLNDSRTSWAREIAAIDQDWPDFSDYPFKVLLMSAGRPISRVLAADLASKVGACISEFAIFLDDDDAFLPGHLDALETALFNDEDAVLAHTAAMLSFGPNADSGQSIEHKIGRRFEPWELLYSNHIPIHCALFRTAFIHSHQVTFDTQFNVYEDWDFWLQFQTLGRFLWVPGCSARYFSGEASAGSSKVHEIDRLDESYKKIWQKWQCQAPAQWWYELLASTGPNLNRLEAFQQTVEHLNDLRGCLEDQLEQSNQRGKAQEQTVDALNRTVAMQVEAMVELRGALATQLGENQRLHELLASALRDTEKQRENFEKRMQTLTSLLEQFEHREQALLEELSKAHDAAEQWRRRGESLATQAAQLQHQLQAVLMSRSWRITEPLRWLGTFARRIGLGKLLRRLRGLRSQLTLGLASTSRTNVESARVATIKSASTEDHSQTIPPIDLRSLTLDAYQNWISRKEAKHFVESRPQLINASNAADPTFLAPLISIVMPIFNAPLAFFKEAIASVQNQNNPNWELCIADDASTDEASLVWLKETMALDPRIKLVERSENGHIVACSNSALSLATAQWVALMDQDDLLSPYAITEVLKAIERFPNAMLIYSDEDKINSEGYRSDPYFKPAFNLELLRAQNTFSHLGVFKRSLVNEVGGFQHGTEGSQDHDLVLRCVERLDPEQVIHIPKVLYHWRIHEQSTASAVDAKPYAITNGLKAVNNHLQRTAPGAKAVLHESIAHYVVRYPLPLVLPSIDILIPTRNGFDLLDRCLETLFKQTHYPKMKVTVVDNGSDDSRVIDLLDRYKKKKMIDVIHYDKAFNFSAINNLAVALTGADYLLFLNNDVEIIRADWLDEMIRLACRSDVGAVGATLWYPDMTVQHAGVVIGAGGVAGHAHHRLAFGHPGYFGRAAFALEVSAVTAACLLMRRKVFLEVGGFDEKGLAVAFNDVDLCLKVRRLGYKVIFTPRAQLIHHESATRGNDLAPDQRDRFERECDLMRHRWAAVINNDPSYNPNLELMTSTYLSYAEPRDCNARSNQLPSVLSAV